MHRVLFEYDLDPTTWVYLSSLMTIGIYFKFRRFWSVRNLDLIGLIAFAPGLLLVARSEPHLTHLGYVWLAVVGVGYLVRLLIDPMMVRRPLLEPNLSVDGLTFTGVVLLVFLVANVVMTPLSESDHRAAKRMDKILAGEISVDELPRQHGPGYPLFHVFATFSNEALVPDAQAEAAEDAAHPVAVAVGEVVVDGDDVDAFAREGVQVGGQRGDEGLALTGLHLRDHAAVESDPADELDVEVPHLEDAPAGLADDGEGFGQEVVEGFALLDPAPKLGRLRGQLRI